MNKAYNPIIWENSPSENTPINEDNLNRMSSAIDTIDSRVVTHETTKANQADLLTAVADVTFDESTGVFTITKKNGSSVTIDTKLDRLILNGRFDAETQTLYLVLDDGTEMPIDLSSLIATNEFVNSDRITLTVSADGKVTADIVKGSITGEYLEPNYLANVTAQADSASQSAETAITEADRATTEADRAEAAASKAESIVGGDYATNAKVDAIIDGTTTVGNADKLDGHDSDYFALKTDLANYLPLSGGTIIGNTGSPLKIKGTDASTTWLDFLNSNAEILGSIGYSGVGNPYVYIPKVGAKELLHTGNYNSYALPLSGGTLTNNLVISTANGKIALMVASSGIGLMDMGSMKWVLRKFGGVYYVDDDKKILHTGNKPSGTYTGNGEATKRTIATGGIGNAVLITGGTFSYIVTPTGAIGVSDSGYGILYSTDATFIGGVLTLTTASAYINSASTTYSYQVL